MNTKRKEEQGDIELLLPWHAAGTLSRRDAARVEQALANDNELARRYDMVREELGEAIRVNESLGAPSARAMKDLFAKIDAEPARTPKVSFNLGAWLTELFVGFSPRTLAYGASIGALAIMLQAGLLTSLIMQDYQDGDTRLASTESTRSVDLTAPIGSFVFVRFNPEATAADITRFLQDNNASVVGGPAAGTGLFRIRVAEKPLSPAELGEIEKRLAQDKKVIALTAPAAQR